MTGVSNETKSSAASRSASSCDLRDRSTCIAPHRISARAPSLNALASISIRLMSGWTNKLSALASGSRSSAFKARPWRRSFA